MLYVGCGRCRVIMPLFCAGQFMPHMPVYADRGPMGVFCPYCGPTPPFFTCTICGAWQMLYLAGAGFVPQMMFPGMPSVVAPVVQAPPSAGQDFLTGMMQDAARSFVKEFFGGLGDQAAPMVSSWLGDMSQSWMGGGDQLW